MHLSLYFCCLLGLLSVALSTKTATHSESFETPSSTITLTGTVYKAPDSSRVLSGALIGLYQNNTYVAVQTTNTKGQFRFKDLPSATYELRVFVDGYEEQSLTVTAAQAATDLWIGLKKPKEPEVVAVEPEPEPEIFGAIPPDAELEEPDGAAESTGLAPDEEAIVTFDPETFEEVVTVVKKDRGGAEEAPKRRAAEARAEAERSFAKAEMIERLPTRDISSIAATTAGVSSADKGEARTHKWEADKSSKEVPVSTDDDIADAPAPEDPTETLSDKKETIDTDRESAGQLTAGVISDHNDWQTWTEGVFKPLKTHADHWELFPTQRYVVQVVNHERVPLPSCVVRLQDAQGNTLWETRTDNTGRAELWDQFYTASAKAAQGLYATVEHDGFSQTVKPLKPYQKGANTAQITTACKNFSKVNIAWVIDATGSMTDELRYLQAELIDVINRIQSSQPELALEQAAVFYRDKGDDYVTRHKAFTEDLYDLQKFINQQVADGGGDAPEAVEEALEVALEQLEWDEDALTRLLFLVLDAPPHHSPARLKRLHRLVQVAAHKGIRIIPIASSGINKSTEYLLRSLALATNGHYTFLTNHSGIGGNHIEPTASVYQVEKLNDLLVRLIDQAVVLPFCAGQVPKQLFEEEAPPAAALEALTLFPNPAYNTVKVTIPKGVTQILITDTNGRLLDQWDDLRAGDRQWPVANYAVGVYFLHYVQGGQQKTERLIVGRR